MEPVQVLENVYWVGAVDYSIRDFHGYRTEKGSTYNAFLIMDEKITLIDTVKENFFPEMVSRISKIVDPARIDQVVSNHAEPDHAGSLAQTMNLIGSAKPLYASLLGRKALAGYFREADLNIQTVKTGDSLSLGRLNLNFIETRMIHWPDSMFTFCPQLGLLFSQDGFGQHLATAARFDDEVSRDEWFFQALTYFANILTPYTLPIEKAINGLISSGLLEQVKIICPDHGLIWRRDPGAIVELYRKWVKHAPGRKAVVAFDSMWHSTEAMARELADALGRLQVETRLMDLKVCHRSLVAAECLEAGAVLVGSPTINNEMYPSVAELLCYMKGLRFQNKIGAAFGSYGWSGEAPGKVRALLEAMKFSVPSPEIRLQWAPREADLEPVKLLARTVAGHLPAAEQQF